MLKLPSGTKLEADADCVSIDADGQLRSGFTDGVYTDPPTIIPGSRSENALPAAVARELADEMIRRWKAYRARADTAEYVPTD